jgi:transcriptional regulator with XRE-family HTH domain
VTEPSSALSGARVRAWRLEAGLTQQELAHRTQLSVRTIANVESGRVARPHAHSMRRLVDALAQAGPAPDLSGPTSALRQLPSDLPDFTGRAEQVHTLCDYLQAEAGRPKAAAVAGAGGIGKTTLALRAAHMLADRFADGQLFLNLGGTSEPVPAGEALGRLLLALGVDSALIPNHEQDRAALYRSVLAVRRVLIVLDNAADEGQVRPLLPGTGACATIITSRRRLDALDAATVFELDLLPVAASVQLLNRIVGPERIDEDPAAAWAIAGHCGGLPLAVRISGARLAARRELTLAALARSLADERHRLDELRTGDLAVRASIEIGYAALDAGQQRALRLLGVVSLQSFSGWVLGPLLDVDGYTATTVADRLAERRLLDAVGADLLGEPRYRIHDLVRLYASERSAVDEPTQRNAAIDRYLGCWLAMAGTLTHHLPSVHDMAAVGDAQRWPPDPTVLAQIERAPADWFRAERSNLAGAVELAARAGRADHAWQIASAMGSAARLFGDLDLLLHVHRVALDACRAGGNRRGEAAALAGLAQTFHETGQYERAVTTLRAADALFIEVDDAFGCAYTAIHLGNSERAVRQQAGDTDFAQARWWALRRHGACQDF